MQRENFISYLLTLHQLLQVEIKERGCDILDFNMLEGDAVIWLEANQKYVSAVFVKCLK